MPFRGDSGKCPVKGAAVVWPAGVEKLFDISQPTRWRWERIGRLPARDVNIGGKTGWKPATIAALVDGPVGGTADTV